MGIACYSEFLGPMLFEIHKDAWSYAYPEKLDIDDRRVKIFLEEKYTPVQISRFYKKRASYMEIYKSAKNKNVAKYSYKGKERSELQYKANLLRDKFLKV